MSWYQKNIVPRLLSSGMSSKQLEKIRHSVLRDAKGVVLEVGIGPGYNIPLYKNISKLYALDPSKELIEIARTRNNSSGFPVEFLNEPAEKIPLPNSSVDTVVSTWTLCSVSDPKQVLSEIKRVLRPQGNFIFVDHGASPNLFIRTIQMALTPLTKYFTGNCHYNREIETLLKEVGFSIKKIEHPHERFKPLIYNYQGIAY
jgi:ubiquinone/menaquinone biosynthesis C-methylase UbiE